MAATESPTINTASPPSATSCLSPEDTAKEMERYRSSPATRRFLAYTTLMYVGVFLLIGLPVWWKTTSTQRSWLPSAGIQTLSSGGNVVVSVRLVVLNMDGWLEVDQLAIFEQQLFDDLATSSPGNSIGSDHGVRMNYHGLVRQCVGNELEILSTSTNLRELEEGLVSSRSIAFEQGGYEGGRRPVGGQYSAGDTYYLVLLPNTTRLLPTGSGLASAGLIRAKNKLTFIRSTGDLTALRSLVVRLVHKVLVREPELKSAYHTSLSRALPESRSPRDRDRLRQVKSSAAYDITLTLVNPEPERITAGWDIKEGLRLYLDPFLARLTRYISLSVKSQNLFCVDLETSALPSTSTNGYFAYNEAALPHLINALEHYLPNQVSNNPHLHMIVYIPAGGRSPLHIHDSRQQKVATNAFLSHQWGGLLVYNSPAAAGNSSTSERHTLTVDLRQVMEVFVPQLKVLLGLKRLVPRIILPLEESDATGMTRWELDSWLRRATLENIGVATATLASLVDLTEKVVNMVICEEIAAEVIKSLDAVQMARHHLKSGLLHEAFLASKRGLVAAETAFFDPSLLELLYFQDDQKYGIYMPLFIPVALPLIMSVFQAIKFLRRDWEKAKVE